MRSGFRKFLIVIWLGLWPLLFWCLWTPIPFSALKIGASIALCGLWIGAPLLFPRTRPLAAISAMLALTLVFWPARPDSPRVLSREYGTALQNYGGTRYLWGGENGRGIDCSGLVRRGMIDALLQRGWQTQNPSLWREAAVIWWRDCSAREMKNGYSGRLEQRFEAPSLNGIDTSLLQTGDLAVMRSGVHVLAFVGEKGWIQADPNLSNGGDKVIFTRAPSKNGWFSQRAVICRWKILDSR
jgi:hypothetical protein